MILTRGLRTTEIFLNFLLFYPAKKQGKFSRKIQNIILLWIFPLWICCLQDNRAGISNYILTFFTLFHKAYMHLLHITFYYSFNWIIFLKNFFSISGNWHYFSHLEHCAPFPPSILWNRKSKKEDVSSIISLNSRNTQPRYQSQDFQIAKSTLSRNISRWSDAKKLCSWYRIGQNVDLYYKIFS